MPFGMKVLTLPFPYFKTTFFRLIYNLLFLVLYHVALPAAEVAYYTVFLPELMPESANELTQNLFISGFYALFNWFAIIFIVKRFFAQLFVTGLTFGIMFGIMIVKKKKGLSLAIIARYVISIGVLIWLLWLAMTRKGWLNRKQPVYNFSGNVKNIWRRGG
jgi:hypothetical protein